MHVCVKSCAVVMGMCAMRAMAEGIRGRQQGSARYTLIQVRVNECPKNRYKGFTTFEEANSHLEDAGHTTFHFDQGLADGSKSRSPL
jgi:hypothetical protein